MWAFQNQTNKIEGQGMTVEIDNKDKKHLYFGLLCLCESKVHERMHNTGVGTTQKFS